MAGYSRPQLSRIEALLKTLNTGTDTTRPVVTTSTLTAFLTTAANYEFPITFTDNVNILRTSISGTGVTMTGPNAFSKTATLVSLTPAANATSMTGTFRIAGPFVAGTYTVTVAAGAVLDTANNSNVLTTVGTVAAT